MKTAKEITKELENEIPIIQTLILERWEIEIRTDQMKRDTERTLKIIDTVYNTKK